MVEPARVCDDSCCGEGVPRQVALRELGRFSQGWRWRRLIELAPGERLTRRQMEARLAARAHQEPELLADIRQQPRWAYMVAAFDTFGISKLRFLEQVREVRLLEETPELLYLVLPGRARLQADLESAVATGGAVSERERVDGLLVERAERERAFRDALLFRPGSTYRAAAGEAAGGAEPAWLAGVREVRVIPETDTSIAFVLPRAAGG